MDNRAIGVFDSGLGGLTAVRRLQEIMPQERIIYFGDTGRVPYGTRGRDIIIKYARQDVAFLRQFDLKAIIVACNTVSSVALDLLGEENDIPIIGTVEPACRRALRETKNGRIGVIGTVATVRSGAYERRLTAERSPLALTVCACPLFVPLVENGRVSRGDIVIETVVREYLTPLREAGVDTLILGCTHYPLLTGVIGRVMGEGVTLVTSSEATANVTYNELVDRGLLHDPWPAGQGPQHQFLATGASDAFPRLARRFLGPEVGSVVRVSTGGGVA